MPKRDRAFEIFFEFVSSIPIFFIHDSNFDDAYYICIVVQTLLSYMDKKVIKETRKGFIICLRRVLTDGSLSLKESGKNYFFSNVGVKFIEFGSISVISNCSITLLP